MSFTKRWLTVAAIALLAVSGCSDAAKEPAPASAGAEAAQVEAPVTDLEQESVGDNTLYKFDDGKIRLTVPSEWTALEEPSTEFPLKLRNAEDTQLIAFGTVGRAKAAPEMGAYEEKLTEKLGLQEGEISYLGDAAAGNGSYPAFGIVTSSYAARIYLVEVNHTLYELTVRGVDEQNLNTALGTLESLQIDK